MDEIKSALDDMLAGKTMDEASPDDTTAIIMEANINMFRKNLAPYLSGEKSIIGAEEVTKDKIKATIEATIEALTLIKNICERGKNNG
jgi:hypothetical protein